MSPALAVIDEIGSRADIIFVGKKYDPENEKTFALEYREVAKKNVLFYNLQTGRLTRLFNFKSFINLLKIPLGFYQALRILIKEKPNSILSFGGYIGFPVCLIGFLLKIPVYIHEQTSKPGLTNRITGLLAKKIFISFEETKKYFSPEKIIASGNPVRKSVLKVSKKPFNFLKNKPVIYITGGSLGSHSINNKIKEILPGLLEKYIVIHQTGSRIIKNILPDKLKTTYFPREHFFADEIGYIYSISDLVIGRSGANTLFELIAWKKPAILIPLPWSANQEQLGQAEIFQKSGTGEIFDQNNESKNLLNLVDKVLSDIDNYKNNFKNVELFYKKNAAQTIVQTLLSSIIS